MDKLNHAVDTREIATRWATDSKQILIDAQLLKDAIDDEFEHHSTGHFLKWKPIILKSNSVGEAIETMETIDMLPRRALCCLIWMEYLQAFSGLIQAPKFNVLRSTELAKLFDELGRFLTALPIAQVAKKRFIPPADLQWAASSKVDLELEDILRKLQIELDIASEFAASADASRDCCAPQFKNNPPAEPEILSFLKTFKRNWKTGEDKTAFCREYVEKHCPSDLGAADRFRSYLYRYLKMPK